MKSTFKPLADLDLDLLANPRVENYFYEHMKRHHPERTEWGANGDEASNKPAAQKPRQRLRIQNGVQI